MGLFITGMLMRPMRPSGRVWLVLHQEGCWSPGVLMGFESRFSAKPMLARVLTDTESAHA